MQTIEHRKIAFLPTKSAEAIKDLNTLVIRDKAPGVRTFRSMLGQRYPRTGDYDPR